MSNYIMTGSGTLNVPEGLDGLITSVDAHGSSTVHIYNDTINYTLDGLNNNLNIQFGEDLTVEVSGSGTYANVNYNYIGDQTAYRVNNKTINPNNAGFYPGAWGSGTGSKSRG